MDSSDRVIRATGDVRKILIIRPLFYETSRSFNNMPGNKLPTRIHTNKLILALF